MKQLFYSLSPIWRILPIQAYISLTGQKVVFPFYHTVDDDVPAHIKHLYRPRTTKEFEQDIDTLLSNYNPISLEDLIAGNITKPSFLLTFDDGLSEYSQVAAPILAKKGIPAVNFINTDFIDNKGLFFRFKESLIVEQLESDTKCKSSLSAILECNEGDVARKVLSLGYKDKETLDRCAEAIGLDFGKYLREHKPYMTTEEIKSLEKQGFRFGAHSTDHPLYSQLTIQEQVEKTDTSLKQMSSILEHDSKAFSFPFTDAEVSKDFFDKCGARITFGTAGIKHDSVATNYQRIPMEGHGISCKDILAGEYAYFAFKALFNKNYIRR